MANDPKKRSALCDSRNPDLVHSRHRTRRGRNRADHVYGRLCDARRDAMAGHAVDGFLFPGRDGFALSYLCFQLENSAKRIHRARPIWRSLRLPRPRYVDCADLDCAERTIQKPLIMVSLLEM